MTAKVNRNYLTPGGWQALKRELYHLVHHIRPELVEVVSWAASNGDRSENGDYLYGKKRLRETDRRIRYLTKRLEIAEVVDPELRQQVEQIFFGAEVTLRREGAVRQTVYIVGVDEIDAAKGKISWQSPLAQALLGHFPGDEIDLKLPDRTETILIDTVRYIPIE
ncbi:MAG: transcription elongation factor GreB [Neisseriaceae bacterium]